MIKDNNGDYWIWGDKELDKDYSKRHPNNYECQSHKSFFDIICQDEYNDEYVIPRKYLQDTYDGYWCGSGSLSNVMAGISKKSIFNDWSSIHLMPWGQVAVVWHKCCEGDQVNVFDDYDSYLKEVTIP